MYTTIIDNTPQHEDCTGYIPCINCNWKLDYFDEVKAAATIHMNKWNAQNDSCDHIDDWKMFVEEAIEDVREMPFVRTICDNCNYCD